MISPVLGSLGSHDDESLLPPGQLHTDKPVTTLLSRKINLIDWIGVYFSRDNDSGMQGRRDIVER